jgi:hypothetical protein
LLRRVGKIQGDQNPAPYELGFALTTGEMKKFNAWTPPDPRVYYLSVYTAIDSYRDDPRYGFTRRYLERTAGPNGGIVAGESARWHGERLKTGDGVSRREILDHRKSSTGSGTIFNIYAEILKRLAERGF